MSRSSNRAARIIRDRKAANGLGTRRSTLNNAVKAAAPEADAATRKGVSNALRTAAKPLRESGELGPVKAKRCAVADGVRGMKYLYTAEQARRVAESYRPRKDEYKAVRAELLAR